MTEEANIKQQQLEEIEGIREDLGQFLSEASFGKNEKGVQLCDDKDLPKASQKFLTAKGFHGKKHNVLRIHGIKYPIKAKRGADIIPINLWEGKATVSSTNMVLGTVTHVTKGVIIEVEQGAILDLLYVIE